MSKVKLTRKIILIPLTLLLTLLNSTLSNATTPIQPTPNPITISATAVSDIVNSLIPKGQLSSTQAKIFLQLFFAPQTKLPEASYQRALSPLVKEKYLTQVQANLIAKALSFDQTSTIAKLYSKLPPSTQTKIQNTLNTLIYPKLLDKLSATLATLTKNKTLTTVQANNIYTLLRPYLTNGTLNPAPPAPNPPTPTPTPISGYEKLIKLQQTGIINTELLNKISKGLPDALSVAYQLRIKNTLLPLVVNKTLTLSEVELLLTGAKPQFSNNQNQAISKALASAPKFDSLTAEKQYFSTLKINGIITTTQFEALLTTLPLTS